nr:hypothetical protein [Tanacetum cinerariifolium]
GLLLLGVSYARFRMGAPRSSGRPAAPEAAPTAAAGAGVRRSPVVFGAGTGLWQLGQLTRVQFLNVVRAWSFRALVFFGVVNLGQQRVWTLLPHYHYRVLGRAGLARARNQVAAGVRRAADTQLGALYQQAVGADGRADGAVRGAGTHGRCHPALPRLPRPRAGFVRQRLFTASSQPAGAVRPHDGRANHRQQQVRGLHGDDTLLRGSVYRARCPGAAPRAAEVRRHHPL